MGGCVGRPSEISLLQLSRKFGRWNRQEPSGVDGYNGNTATDLEDCPKFDAMRMQRRGSLVFLVLLPVAALIGAGVVGRPFSWGDWALATLTADLIICLCIAAAALFLGLAISLTDRESEVSRTFMGFGASLGVVFFEGIALAGILYGFLQKS